MIWVGEKRAKRLLVGVILTVLAGLTLLPFFVTLLMSQKTNGEILNHFWAWPEQLHPEYYGKALAFARRATSIALERSFVETPYRDDFTWNEHEKYRWKFLLQSLNVFSFPLISSLTTTTYQWSTKGRGGISCRQFIPITGLCL